MHSALNRMNCFHVIGSALGPLIVMLINDLTTAQQHSRAAAGTTAFTPNRVTVALLCCLHSDMLRNSMKSCGMKPRTTVLKLHTEGGKNFIF